MQCIILLSLAGHLEQLNYFFLKLGSRILGAGKELVDREIVGCLQAKNQHIPNIFPTLLPHIVKKVPISTFQPHFPRILASNSRHFIQFSSYSPPKINFN